MISTLKKDSMCTADVYIFAGNKERGSKTVIYTLNNSNCLKEAA
jgi:hypothetical protein